MHSTASLVADLGRLGVVSGDTLMVHASLRRVGPVDGRAAAVVRALDDAVGPAGSWMMTLGADDDGRPFDARTTRAERDVSVLAEVMRTTPGTQVSDHPEGRVGVRGRLAAAFTRDVPWDDYYGPGSPLERLLDAGGRVLRLGADINTVTLLHYTEYVATVPDKRRVRRSRAVTTTTGVAMRTVDCLDDSNGIVAFDGPDYFGLLLEAYLAGGHALRGLVGSATSELIDARDLHAFGVAWMNQHLNR